MYGAIAAVFFFNVRYRVWWGGLMRIWRGCCELLGFCGFCKFWDGRKMFSFYKVDKWLLGSHSISLLWSLPSSLCEEGSGAALAIFIRLLWSLDIDGFNFTLSVFDRDRLGLCYRCLAHYLTIWSMRNCATEHSTHVRYLARVTRHVLVSWYCTPGYFLVQTLSSDVQWSAYSGIICGILCCRSASDSLRFHASRSEDSMKNFSLISSYELPLTACKPGERWSRPARSFSSLNNSHHVDHLLL